MIAPTYDWERPLLAMAYEGRHSISTADSSAYDHELMALFRWPPGCYLRLNGGRPGHFTPFAAPPMISLTSQRATPQRHCATGGERPCPAARSGMIWLPGPGPIPAFAIKFPGNTPSNSSTALSVTCTRPGTLPLKIWLNIAMVLPLQSG